MIENYNDNLCLARAVVTAKAKFDSDPQYHTVAMGTRAPPIIVVATSAASANTPTSTKTTKIAYVLIVNDGFHPRPIVG